MKMASPTGANPASESKALKCQTGPNRVIEAQELFRESSNLEPPTGQKKSPPEPARYEGADLDSRCEADNTDDRLSEQQIWDRFTVIERQPETAIYRNLSGHIVIRQRPFDYRDEDIWVTIDPLHLPELIERLKEMVDEVEP